IDKSVWNVFADQAQLELAMVNLIINARDAMPAGGTVVITAENRRVGANGPPMLAPGEYVRIAVKDEGTGIAPDLLEKVMEPFFTTKEMGKGSGLGLSMVYGFAKQSNGAFLIESELGAGTTAELWLPRAPFGSETRPKVPQKPRRTAKLPRLKVLLVDDHAEVRSTTAAVLEDFGHEVVQAANGRDALALLKGRDCECDLLISDYAMPHVSGTEFIREARKLCPDVPALIITGYAEAEAVIDRPENVEILLKPFTPTALEGAIERICRAEPVTV
ncbi:MAG TPA: ATP-binding protein, partial [Sphingomicrobium sp.]